MNKRAKDLIMRTISVLLIMLLVVSDGHLIAGAQMAAGTQEGFHNLAEPFAAEPFAIEAFNLSMLPIIDPGSEGDTGIPEGIFVGDDEMPEFDPAYESGTEMPDGFPADDDDVPVSEIDFELDDEIPESTPADGSDVPVIDYLPEYEEGVMEGIPADNDEPDLYYSLRDEDEPEGIPADDDEPILDYITEVDEESEPPECDIPEDCDDPVLDYPVEITGFTMSVFMTANDGDMPALEPSNYEIPEGIPANDGDVPALDYVSDFPLDNWYFPTATPAAIEAFTTAITRVTIVYNGNGHTEGVVPASQVVNTPGGTFLPSPGSLVRRDHAFGGWVDTAGRIFQPGQYVSWSAGASGTVTFTARWIPNVVTIQYRGNGHTGGSVARAHTVSTPGGTTLAAPGNMVRAGHAFGGWRDSSGWIFQPGHPVSWSTITSGTVILDAHWIPNVVTIQYMGNGYNGGRVPANQTLSTPGSITLRQPGNMTRTGHTFGGWRDSLGRVFPGGHRMTWDVIASGTLTLHAHWIPNVVTIQYSRGTGSTGTIPANQTVITPGSINLAAAGNLRRVGHTFGGWRDSSGRVFRAGQTVTWPVMTSGTVNLEAYWIPNVITIQYRGNRHTAGSVPRNQTVITPGSVVLAPRGNLVRSGHAFAGWRDSSGRIFQAGQAIGWSHMASGTVVLEAHWVPNVVRVQYRSVGHTSGSVPSAQNVSTPGSVNLRAPGNMARVGHSFGGWRDSSGRIFESGQRVTWTEINNGTIELTAIWIPNVMTIHYRDSRGLAAPSQTLITPGSISLATPPSNLRKAGHSFGGWRDSTGRIFQPRQTISWNHMANGTVTFYAVWIPNVVTVQFRSTGHNFSAPPRARDIVTPGYTVLPPTAMTRPGHAFEGWRDTSGRVFQPGHILTWHHMTNGTVTLHAHWVPNALRIQYRGNGHTSGSVPSAQNVNTPGSVNLRAPGTMQRAGYVFGGWRDSSGNIFQSGQNLRWARAAGGTITLDAVWLRPSTAFVAYSGNGSTSGSVPTGHTVDVPGSFVARVPGNLARAGYVFGGWQHEASGRVFQPGQTVDVTVSGTMRLDPVWNPDRRLVWWWVFDEPLSNVHFRITVEREAQFYNHRDVYIGVASRLDSSLENVYVSRDGNSWTFIGLGMTTPFTPFSAEYTDILARYTDLTYELNRINPHPYARISPVHRLFNPFTHNSMDVLVRQYMENIANAFGDWSDMVLDRFLDFVEGLIRLADESAQQRQMLLEAAIASMNEALDQLMRDLNRGALNVLGTTVARLLQLLHVTSGSLAPDAAVEQRFAWNNARSSTIINNGFIYGQGGQPQDNLLIGLTGRGSGEGCGPFAVYNALFHMSGENNRPNPAMIIRWLDMAGAFNLGGSLGTNPQAMLDYLRVSGMSASIEYLPENLNLRINNPNVRASILLYIGDWSSRYVHYVMIIHDGSEFLIYNLEVFDTAPTPQRSINSWVNYETYIPFALITIR